MAAELIEVEDGLMTEKIPVTIMQKYIGKEHPLLVDNHYTSLPLAQYFQQNETSIT